MTKNENIEMQRKTNENQSKTSEKQKTASENQRNKIEIKGQPGNQWKSKEHKGTQRKKPSETSKTCTAAQTEERFRKIWLQHFGKIWLPKFRKIWLPRFGKIWPPKSADPGSACVNKPFARAKREKGGPERVSKIVCICGFAKNS